VQKSGNHLTRRYCALCLLALLAAGRAAGQVVGAEFPVNTFVTDNQIYPSVASSSSGFVIVWQSDASQDGSSYGIFGQRFSVSGAPLGFEFQINTYTTLQQSLPAVAADSAGNFVVVWQSVNGSGVFGQLFSSSGTALGGEFRVSTLTNTIFEGFPRVAVAPAGSIVVVWTGDSNLFGLGEYAIFGQRFSGSGARLGSEFRVSSYVTDVHQGTPAVASDGSGNFVVVWSSALGRDGDGYGVFGRRFGSGGTPLGGDFRVNTHTLGNQWYPAVSSDSSGNFVVAWADVGLDGSGYGVFAQRFASSGVPLGSEFRVNTYTTSHQVRTSVTSDGSGNFVIVWASIGGEDGSLSGVFGQRYVASGAPLGSEFRLNTYTTSYQYLPSVASDAAGNFVAAWQSIGQDGSSYGIFAQRLALPPVPLGDEFRINTYTTSFQLTPSVGMDTSGDFVVVWSSDLENSGLLHAFDISGQRYNAAGVVLGTEFQVNTFTTGKQDRAAVALASSGAFVVVWTSYDYGSSSGVFGRRYTSSGAPLGDEFRVNAYTTGIQIRAAVASDSPGNTVVVWSSLGPSQDGSSYGIYGQRYSSAGALVGDEFRVNTYTTNGQTVPSVASSATGSFVVVWQSQDGSGYGIWGQRFASTGTPLGDEFRVNSSTAGHQKNSRVASDAAGDFVVVWESGPTGAISGQRFASTGAPLGGEIVVSTSTGNQAYPAVAMNGTGDFVVTWSASSGGGDAYEVFAQRYKANGQPVGVEFQVNTYTTLGQTRSAVALGASLLVVWQGDVQDGDATGIFGQRYRPCRPSDMDGNGHVDVADVFYLINALFAGGPAPNCGGDVDGSGHTDVADVFYLINFLFAGGPPPLG
jgi:hypothetical protein